MSEVDRFVNALIREHLGRTGNDAIKEFDINIPRTDQDISSTKILAESLNISNLYRQKRKAVKKGERKVSILETVVEKILNSRKTKQPKQSVPKKSTKPIVSSATKSLVGFDIVQSNENMVDNSVESAPTTQRAGWGMETTQSNNITATTKSAPSPTIQAPVMDDMMEEEDLDSVDFSSL